MHGHAQALWELRELRAQLDRDSRRVRQRRYLQSRRVDPQLDLQPLADPTQALQAARGQRCRSNLGTRIRRHSRRRRQASRRAFRRRNALQESASEASSSPVRPQRRPLNPADLVTGNASRFFSIATRAQVRKIGLGNSKMLAARGRKRSQSTPCDQRIKRTNPRVSSSRPSVSVDTIMPEPALWNRRSNA